MRVSSFVIDNMQTFQTNAGRQDLHMPNTNLTKYEKGVYCSPVI